jgi:hypothetical protein
VGETAGNRQWIRIAIVLAVVFVTCGNLVITTGRKEPRFEGKTAKRWFQEWNGNAATATTTAEYLRAMRQLAPRSLEYLAAVATGSRVQQAKRTLWELRPRFATRHFPQPLPGEVLRFRGLKTLMDLRAPADLAVPAYFVCLREKELAVRSQAVTGLKDHLKNDPELLKRFVSLLDAREVWLRESVLYGLGAIGPDASTALPRLIWLAELGEMSERFLAIEVAFLIDPDQRGLFVSALARLLSSELSRPGGNADTIGGSLRLLWRCGPIAGPAAAAIRQAANSTNGAVSAVAAESLLRVNLAAWTNLYGR